MRYASYLAIMAIVGILLTTALVWTGAGRHPILRRMLSHSLSATAAIGFLQLLVVASDISGEAPWSSFGSIDAAMITDAGIAFAIRIDLATRIKGVQDPEVEMMTGWLTATGQPVMMDASDGHDMSSMDGMMTAEMKALLQG